ncbi:MAG: hypothetical protein KGS61_05385 [Verrucomicrobia bacterium]|nr:hypothetical protein [Verrucomicrobiota bacterium]
MIRFGTSICLGLGLLTLAEVVRGSIAQTNASNPYLVIVDRNAFGLKPPPPPPEPKVNKPPENHTVKFTGISRDATGRKAYLIVQDPVKPGQQPTPQYYCLAEGERQGDIEVKAINEAAETVTILNGNETLTLNFKDHGNTASPQPAAPPPRPGALPGAPPAPGVPPAPGLAYPPGYRGYPPGRTPGTGPSQAVNAAAGADSMSQTLPTRDLRTMTGVPQAVAATPQVQAPLPVNPDAQKALMLINSQINAGGGFPPLPPLE